MIISIGILAWNEEESIGISLRSLLKQSLIRELKPAHDQMVEVVVVPNGCKDNTEEQAILTLRQFAGNLPEDTFTWRVESLDEPGKINAWNQYVHRFSHPDADYIFLMDADIRFDHPDTLKNMVHVLQMNAHASASVDLPRKHIFDKARKTLSDRISLRVSGMTHAAPGQLTGQLYCVRGPLLREIFMPPGLILDDGFIKQLLCTDMMRTPCDNSRITRAPDASHIFEAYTGIKDVFLNQRRQQIGHTVYTYLRDYLIEELKEKSPGEIIAENNERDPDWFRKVMGERIRRGGWWVMYPGAFSVRWRRLKNLSFSQAILSFPITVAAFIIDIAVLSAANHRLRSGRLTGIWSDTKSRNLEQPGTADNESEATGS